MATVNFINRAIQPPSEEYECPICWDKDSRDYYIIHNGENGAQHPIHYSCVKKCLEQNLSCPSCRAPTSNNLASKSEKIVNLTKTSFTGASLGLQSVTGNVFFGAAAAAAIAGLIISGMEGTQDALAVLGYVLAPAAMAGIFGALSGPGPGAEDRISPMAIAAALTGTLLGVVSFAMGQTRSSNAVQIAGALPILYSAGKASFLMASSIGAIVSGAALKTGAAFGMTNAMTAASIGGTSGAFVNARKASIGITLISAFSGITMSKLAAQFFGKYGSLPAAILGGAIGGTFASTASTLLDRGYRSLKEWIVTVSSQPDN